MNNAISSVEQPSSTRRLLTISIVTFNPNFYELKKTLSSLMSALQRFQPQDFTVTIVDNSSSNDVAAFLSHEYPTFPITLIHGQGNIGFGRAHNMSLQQNSEFHLILNPDIQLNVDSLVNAVAFMRANENCGLLSPLAVWPNGQRQYLCKRYPAVFDLLLRGFAPTQMRSLFKRRLARYEMQAETQDTIYWNPHIVSGCFMFFRSSTLLKAGGFSDKFFLYFEDFDLSLRSRRIADVAYVPAVRVVHTGGHAARKGIWHINVFIHSAVKFYINHGIKLF